MLGVNNLGQQHRRGQLAERVAESENETTSAEHCRRLASACKVCAKLQLTSVVLSGSVDDTPDDHEDAAEDDAGLAAETIGNGRP